jgi:hypothetical protein
MSSMTVLTEMTKIKWIAPAIVLAIGALLFPKVGGAKPDYTRRTGQTCEYCHPPNSRALNEAGEYYAAHKRSLSGYRPKEQAKDKNSKAGETKAK